jgi:hypothetical protein
LFSFEQKSVCKTDSSLSDELILACSVLNKNLFAKPFVKQIAALLDKLLVWIV